METVQGHAAKKHPAGIPPSCLPSRSIFFLLYDGASTKTRQLTVRNQNKKNKETSRPLALSPASLPLES